MKKELPREINALQKWRVARRDTREGTTIHASRKSLLEDMGGTDDQIDRFCCIRLRRHNVSAGNAFGADSRAGEHDHPSRRRMRSGQDTC
jgi:hypothetical protein